VSIGGQIDGVADLIGRTLAADKVSFSGPKEFVDSQQ
jgi:hypothetical protein